jgi:hypothetical protein
MQASDTSQLDNLGVQDLIEIEEGIRDNPNVEVLVQIHRRWPGVPQRYLISDSVPDELQDNTSPARRRSLVKYVGEPSRTRDNGDKGEKTNMGKKAALVDFLNAASKWSQGKNVCLVLWGHAFGLGFGRDHHDPLTLAELGEALNAFSRASSQPIDVLATNACTMSYIEAAFELQPSVSYLVASQVFVPLTGLPYRSILRNISEETDPSSLGRKIVDRYVGELTNSPRGEKVAMAVLNLAHVKEFRTLLDEVADAITEVIGEHQKTDFDRLSEIRDVFLANPAGDVRPVLDLASLAADLTDLCKSWATNTVSDFQHGNGTGSGHDSIDRLIRAADELKKAVDHNGERSSDQDTFSGQNTFMVHHREHPDLDGMNGVGVFAPFVVDKSFLMELELDEHKGRAEYKKLKIFENGKGNGKKWVSLVFDRLRLEEPDEIVDSTGVVRPAERVLVNQLIVAVEAAFNRLDRVLQKAEDQVSTELKKKNTRDVGQILGSFGPPHLKLAGDLSLLDPEELGKRGLDPALAKSAHKGDQLPPIVSILSRIESAVQRVVKTTKMVVTNRTFGLGPPSSKAGGTQGTLHLGKPAGEILGKPAGEILGKPAGEILGKPAGEILGKPAGEILGKPAGEILGPFDVALLPTDPQVASGAVSILLASVAVSLMQLERAAADIEATAAQFLFAKNFGAALSDQAYAITVKDRFAATFGVMKEVSLQARRTIRRVLAHPVYGLGPGPEGLDQAERDEVAIAAGLNRRNLALL